MWSVPGLHTQDHPMPVAVWHSRPRLCRRLIKDAMPLFLLSGPRPGRSGLTMMPTKRAAHLEPPVLRLRAFCKRVLASLLPSPPQHLP